MSTNATQTIIAFMERLTQQSDLFAEASQDLGVLEQQVKVLADNQEEEIAKAIQSFCRKHPKVRDSIRPYLETQLGPGGQVPTPPTPADQLKDELIIRINAIRTPPKPVNLPKPK